MKQKRILIIKPVILAAFILFFGVMCPSFVLAEDNEEYDINPSKRIMTFIEGVPKEGSYSNYIKVTKDGELVDKTKVKLTLEPELLSGMKLEYDRKVTGTPERITDWKPRELERRFKYVIKLWTSDGEFIKEFKDKCTIVVVRDLNANGTPDRKEDFVIDLSPKSQEIVEAGERTEINPITLDCNRQYATISVDADVKHDLIYDKDTSTIRGTVSVEDWGEETSKEITVTVKGDVINGPTTSQTATIVLKKKPEDPKAPEEPKKPEVNPTEGIEDERVEFKYCYFPLASNFKSENKTTPQNTPAHLPYIKGYPDGTFRPEGLVTKEEALAMILRLKGWVEEGTNVANDAWQEKYFQIAKDKGLLKNIDVTSQGEKITRGELMEILSHFDKKSDAPSTFKDIIGHKYERAIAQGFAGGRIKGYPDGTFKPDQNITRAEIVKILNRMFGREENIESKKDLYTNPFKDLDQNHWAYYEILEAIN